MKSIIKILISVFSLICLIICSSCQSLRLTPEMEECIELYEAAVEKAEKSSSGSIKVTSVAEDNALEFKTTTSVIDFVYTVNDGKVLFERFDYLDGEENAKYISDGEIIKSYDYDTDDWVDKTEENKNFLLAEKNPLTTLSLFRVDSNKKVKTDYLSNITRSTEDGYTVIEFTLKDSTVSTVLGYTKADGVVRESAGHTRSFYLDSDGNICLIKIEAMQNIISNGETGYYKTSMTVEITR